MCVKKLTSDQ